VFALRSARRLACLPLVLAAAVAAATLSAAPAGATTATYCHSTRTSIVGPGESMVFDGQVTTMTGAPVKDVTIALDRWTGSGWTRYLRQVSDSIGMTHFTVAPSATMTVRVSYVGGSTWSACATSGIVVWLSNDSRVVAAVAAHNGAPYLWGGAGPSSFDCSGLMMYVLARFGRSLPHNSQMQYDAVHHISTSSLQQGDLVFFGSTTTGIYHVGMYAGDGYLWHAPGDGQTVKKERIWTSAYYAGRL